MHAAAAQPALNDIVALSAQALSDAIRQRHVSCREVMAAYLTHIDRVNPAVNAIVARRDSDALLREADVRDAELAAGHWRGWLHGMPQAPDLTAVRGMVTSMGSLVFKDQVTAHDSIIAERMRAAGAIFIGRSNVPEFGLGSHTYNQVYGITRNPYDLTRSAGGSGGRPRHWRRACCRWPTAATLAARCAIRRASATFTVSGPRRAACPTARRRKCSSSSWPTKGRWVAARATWR